MDRVRVTSRFARVPGGNLAEFKKAAAQALEVPKNEAATRQYGWFLNEDETACVVHEEYDGSAALLPA